MSLDIHCCGGGEIGEAMTFIERHWKQGHILAHDLRLMDFLHRNPEGNYNIVLAGRGDDITGFLGVIPVSHFDPALTSEKDTWLAIWKNVGGPGDGLALFQEATARFETIGSIGINAKVAKLYKVLGFQLGELAQYYIPNEKTEAFRIAVLPQGEYTGPEKEAELETLSPQEMKVSGVHGFYHPLKSLAYFENRYVKHPYYKYIFLGVRNPGEAAYRGILVVRPIDINGSRCLRIVDVLGDMDSWSSIGGAVQQLLQQTEAEYIDCLNYGVAESVFKRHGFKKADESHVIPNYFEPFLRENISIKLAILNRKNVPYVVFKGDSDQDRPNHLPKGE
ncbi:MAG: hypothetical protein IJS01_14470 [Lentisphaeria bacterium]|nr:hypothetical protein [Lentisphaeria bacterium]